MRVLCWIFGHDWRSCRCAHSHVGRYGGHCVCGRCGKLDFNRTMVWPARRSDIHVLSAEGEAGLPRSSVCNVCAKYQRGECENVTYAGAEIHACERIPENWQARECPCGCVVTASVSGGDTTPSREGA